METDPVTDALAELTRVIAEQAISKESLRAICFSEFGKHKFSDLTDTQKWGMIHLIDPECPGPYKSSMKGFT